jgi:hypothetical protein
LSAFFGHKSVNLLHQVRQRVVGLVGKDHHDRAIPQAAAVAQMLADFDAVVFRSGGLGDVKRIEQIASLWPALQLGPAATADKDTDQHRSEQTQSNRKIIQAHWKFLKQKQRAGSSGGKQGSAAICRWQAASAPRGIQLIVCYPTIAVLERPANG